MVSLKESNRRESPLRSTHRHSGSEDHVQLSEEVTAKLERRKERFGKPRLKKPSEEEMAAGRDEPSYAVEVQADPVEVKQERPARKRRWAGSG